jgi:hypothetical protein
VLLQHRSQVCKSYPGTSDCRCCSLESFGVEFRISVRVIGILLRFVSSSVW